MRRFILGLLDTIAFVFLLLFCCHCAWGQGVDIQPLHENPEMQAMQAKLLELDARVHQLEVTEAFGQ